MVRGGGPARRRAGERERVTRRACRARGRGMERRQGLCTAAARRRFDRNGLTNSVPPTRPLRPLWSLGRCPSHSVRVIPSDLHPSHCFPCHAVRVESEPPMSESKSPPVGSDMARATTTPAVTHRMAVCLDGRAAGVVAGFGSGSDCRRGCVTHGDPPLGPYALRGGYDKQQGNTENLKSFDIPARF